MALFDLTETALLDERKASAKAVLAQNEEVRLSGRYQCLKSTIGEIEHGKTVHYVTSGAWSMHDLAKYVIGQIGACDMDASTSFNFQTDRRHRTLRPYPPKLMSTVPFGVPEGILAPLR